MIRRGSSRTKYPTLCWHMRMLLLALSVTGTLIVPGAHAASALPAPAGPPQTAFPTFQSCDNAYDQTGVGGAGVGQVAAVGNGVYSFSISFNADFIAAHPPTTDFVWGDARIFVNRSYAFSISTGHPRPISEAFHSHIQLQGHRYGPRNHKRIRRNDLLTFRISLLLIDPVSGTFYPGHGTISCRL